MTSLLGYARSYNVSQATTFEPSMIFAGVRRSQRPSCRRHKRPSLSAEPRSKKDCSGTRAIALANGAASDRRRFGQPAVAVAQLRQGNRIRGHAEARALIDNIDIMTPVGLRDRADRRL